MYLTFDPASLTYVFTTNDPRTEGFSGTVQDNVSLDDDFPEILRNVPIEYCLGRSHEHESEYRVFPSEEDCLSAGFEPLGNQYWTGTSWTEWQEAHQHG